jgi:archaeal cell division control protein 6
MDSSYIKKIVSKIEKEESIFSNKGTLDSLLAPSKIIGRENEAESLVRFLASFKQGYVVPYISIYGRSGAGKSVVVRFVCDNLDELSHIFVNLRQAKTVFGSANLILAELGRENLKSAQGINLAVDTIGKEIESLLNQEGKKIFVLVLDELDAIFYDKRGKPSDFIYKLIVLEEKLRKKGFLLCIIGISNNVLSEYDLDDRVKSRIGSSELFFAPYSKSEVLSILKERALEAFSGKISDKVLERCAEISSAENGDARRAIDLLRIGAELASSAGEDLGEGHIDKASDELQKDRISQMLSSASYHLRLACGSLARITHLTGEAWHSTSVLYKQYTRMVQKGAKPLSYRRVSDLLTELENSGLVVSQTSSKGRHGYGTQYKLVVPPEMIGSFISKEWWEGIVKTKREYESEEPLGGMRFGNLGPAGKRFSKLQKMLNKIKQDNWDDFVGMD